MMGKCQAKLAAGSDTTAGQTTTDSPEPSLLSIFHEDVLLSILGFVADVPFELRGGHGGKFRDYVFWVLTGCNLEHVCVVVMLVDRFVHKII